mgnify:CR=1 FL=1
MATALLNLPLIAEGQAQTHITHNEALDLIDGAFPRVVASATTAAAPASPADGEAYIVPAGASGFGNIAEGRIAIRRGGLWHAIQPSPGARWHVLDEGGARIWTGTAWTQGDVIGASGAALGLRVAEVVLSGVTGASVTAAGLIPARAIVLGVTSWTVADVTGAGSYRVGDAGSDSRYGGSLGIAAGSSNIGVVGPFATYSPTDVIVTAEGGAFTGGSIGLAACVILPGVPQ